MTASQSSATDLMADMQLRLQVEALLVREAYLADESRYSDWLGLWADGDVLYWSPPRADSDPEREVCLIYDDRTRLEQRVARWESGFAWSQDPRSMTRRIVGNLEVRRDGDRVHAASNLLVHVSRRREDWMLSARVEHILVEAGDGLRIAEKKVVLVDPDRPLGNVTFVI